MDNASARSQKSFKDCTCCCSCYSHTSINKCNNLKHIAPNNFTSWINIWTDLKDTFMLSDRLEHHRITSLVATPGKRVSVPNPLSQIISFVNIDYVHLWQRSLSGATMLLTARNVFTASSPQSDIMVWATTSTYLRKLVNNVNVSLVLWVFKQTSPGRAKYLDKGDTTNSNISLKIS